MFKACIPVLLFSSVILSGLSCESGTVTPPACVEEKIAELKSEPVKNPPVEIWKYSFKGETVYYITSYCCDVFSILMNENCQTICSPDGGLTGNGDGRCPDFNSEKKDGVLIWRDSR